MIDVTRRCGAPTKAGAPCRTAMNLADSGLCVQHDPERVAVRLAMVQSGGHASAVTRIRAKAAPASEVPKAPRTLADAVSIASWITRAVLTGTIDVRVAEAGTKAVRQFQLGEEKRALEGEIKKLRAELAAARGKAKP
jgi:hypothetical protein